MSVGGFLSGLFVKKAKHFVLQGERIGNILDPSEDQVTNYVKSLIHPGMSYLQLTHRDGAYVQVMGSRPWCMVERGEADPSIHERAYQDTPVPKFLDGTNLNFGRGSYPLRHDEWFLRKDAAAIMVAFLKDEPMPGFVKWRTPSALPSAVFVRIGSESFSGGAS